MMMMTWSFGSLWWANTIILVLFRFRCLRCLVVVVAVHFNNMDDADDCFCNDAVRSVCGLMIMMMMNVVVVMMVAW